jgi:chemotaxis signal transduction protein
MPGQMWRSKAGGQDLLMEDLDIGLTFDGEPERVEAEVYRFTGDMARLGQGVSGVGMVNGECLPIVEADYFRIDRAPAMHVRTVERASGDAVARPGMRRFFIFGVPGATGFQFALSMNQVLEVSRVLPMADLNFQHSHFAGVTVWRGETVPVIDLALAARLGTIRGATWSRLMIVRNRQNRILAIAANGQVRQPSVASQVYAPDSVSMRPMRGIRGVFRFEGSPLLVPDLDALVD